MKLAVRNAQLSSNTGTLSNAIHSACAASVKRWVLLVSTSQHFYLQYNALGKDMDPSSHDPAVRNMLIIVRSNAIGVSPSAINALQPNPNASM